MQILSRIRIIGFGLLAIAASAGYGHAQNREVPFGDKVSGVVLNYNRTTPNIATSGRIGTGGIPEIKRLGFQTIIDLRTKKEGTADERQKVKAAGLNYFNIEIGRAAPTSKQVAKFAALIEMADHHPILVHCASANRVGAMWALYRMTKGVALEEALAEGRTIGLRPRRERQLRGLSSRRQ